MPLKLDLSQFSLNQFRSYARFDNGQEEKLRSALDHHFAVESFVCALETAIKHRPGILIGGVPIGESTDARSCFKSRACTKSKTVSRATIFSPPYATVNPSRNFAQNLRNSIKDQLESIYQRLIPN